MWMHSKKYNFFSFLGDCFMLMLTCGFWFIWIIVRESRRNSTPKPTYGYPPPHQRQEIVEYRYYE